MDLKRDNLALPPSLTVYRLPKSPNIHATYKDNHTEVLFSSDNTEGLVSQVLSFEYVLPDRFSVRTVSGMVPSEKDNRIPISTKEVEEIYSKYVLQSR
jgi:hypothetical protein